MAKYFQQFPKIQYDMKSDGNVKLATDIFRRVKVRSKVKDNLALLDKYDVESGEKPEDVAFKVYGSTDYWYVVCLMNNIVDRNHDWPKSFQAFETYVNDKYAEPGGIHHYEKAQSSGRTTSNAPGDLSYVIEVDSSDVDGQSVSNYEYEQRLEDEKRQIQVLSPNYLNIFEDEMKKLLRT
tara:strand:+ start:1205 stop:1744 length:540 start_codon:yes stop_codon:yes gene_type:complete